MQTPPPFFQKWPYLHERCPLCWNEWKINFPFCVIFSFWDMVVQNLTTWLKKIHPKRCAMFWNNFFSSRIFLFAIFSFWDMVDFAFNICSELIWDLDKFRILFSAHPNHPFLGALPPSGGEAHYELIMSYISFSAA